MACCYAEAGEITRAEEVFRELSDRFPHSGLFHVNLGRAYIRNGLLLKAGKEFEQAFAKEPRFYYVLFEAGALYMVLKDYNRAIECFEGYYQHSPDSFEILSKMGTCYLAKGMITKARSKYEEALRIKPDSEPALVGLKRIEELEQKHRLGKKDLALIPKAIEV